MHTSTRNCRSAHAPTHQHSTCCTRQRRISLTATGPALQAIRTQFHSSASLAVCCWLRCDTCRVACPLSSFTEWLVPFCCAAIAGDRAPRPQISEPLIMLSPTDRVALEAPRSALRARPRLGAIVSPPPHSLTPRYCPWPQARGRGFQLAADCRRPARLGCASLALRSIAHQRARLDEHRASRSHAIPVGRQSPYTALAELT